MRQYCLIFLLAASSTISMSAQHVGIFLSKADAEAVRSSLGKYPLLDHSIGLTRQAMDDAFAQRMEVPPPGEAGGYEHERHKQNYREMRSAGLLFSITGEERYAMYVRDMLRMYAELYPTLGPHPLAHHQKPGKLFHQTLNEEVWLVHTSIAYDCVYDWLEPSDRELFEMAIFRPMADWFHIRNKEEFDRIHNHGTWAVAAVGMIGYVMGDMSLVEKSLHGSNLDGAGGFLAQLDLLFSPDGYYMEGPYYIRYALMPFFYFAEAVEQMQPDIGIYDYRDGILRKAYYAAVQTAFPDGIFPAINDASLTMDVRAPEVVLANALTYDRYGADHALHGVTTLQGRVTLNGAGLRLARDHAANTMPPQMTWPSVEFRDGHDGTRGGLGILRMGDGPDQSMLLMKYGVHGGGHGHFDKLHFIFFDQGRQVIRDYGFGRWINIEPKWGGRYLPENSSFAMQTVAHNTVVVDGMTQNMFDEDEAEAMSGRRHFFHAENGDALAMSARADDYFDGVGMQRTMLLVHDDALAYPFVVDIYRLTADSTRRYDFPLHYSGQIIASSLDLHTNTSTLQPMGDAYGYEHIWETARAASDSTIHITWLDGHRYYSAISAGIVGTEVLFGRTGAHDPSFNLRSEPLIIVRKEARDHVFATVIEPHGYFSEAQERSVQARPAIMDLQVVGYSDIATVVEVRGTGGLRWQIMVTNEESDPAADRSVSFGDHIFEWSGDFHVDKHHSN